MGVFFEDVESVNGLSGNVVLSYSTTFVNADLSSGILSVTHSLNSNAVLVQVYNNSSLQITPDDIEITGANAVDVDLSSFGTISGTWRVVITA